LIIISEQGTDMPGMICLTMKYQKRFFYTSLIRLVLIILNRLPGNGMDRDTLQPITGTGSDNTFKCMLLPPVRPFAMT